MKLTLPKILLGFTLLAFVFNSCFKDELLKEIDDLRGELTSMQKKNDSLNSVLNVRADSLSKALASAQKRSDSLSNVLKTKSDSLSNALGITNANLASLSKSVDSIKTQIVSINSQLTQLNTQLATITSQLASLNQQLAALGGDVSQLAAQYQALSASLQTINSQIAALQAEQLILLDKLNAILLQINPPVNLTTGLLAYYPFTGNAGDSSGNGNHGVVNGATLTTDRFGNNGQAMKFMQKSVIEAPVDQNNSPSLLQVYSLSIWVNALANSESILFQYRDSISSPPNNNFDLIFSHSRCGVSKIGIQHFPFFNPSACVTNPQALNEWFHLYVVFDKGKNKIVAYRNGVLVAEGSVNNLQFPSKGKLYFGNNSNFAFQLNGLLDDIRIYNRALTQSEITYLANN